MNLAISDVKLRSIYLHIVKIVSPLYLVGTYTARALFLKKIKIGEAALIAPKVYCTFSMIALFFHFIAFRNKWKGPKYLIPVSG